MRNRIPARKPMTPNANICHGVSGPCPKNILLTKPVTAPTRKPASPPNATFAIMMTAVTGLNWGSIKNAIRPATPMAQSTAVITGSLAWGFRLSKISAKGSMDSKMISREMK